MDPVELELPVTVCRGAPLQRLAVLQSCAGRPRRLARCSVRPRALRLRVEEPAESSGGEIDTPQISMESSAQCPDSRTYAVLLFRDKEIRLAPVQGIIQLRPSCSYLDQQTKKKKESGADCSDDEEEEEPEAHQVTVKFARQETEGAKRAREQSYEYLNKKTSEEPWYDAEFHSEDSDLAELFRLQLSCGSVAGPALQLPATRYLSALLPAPSPAAPTIPAATSETSDTPVNIACRDLLVSAQLVRFSEVVRALGAPPDVVLRALVSTGCLVRGLWTPRSSLLHSGPQARARDLLLSLLATQETVSRAQLSRAARLPPATLEAALRSVCRPAGRLWTLRLPPDRSFLERHSDLAERQRRHWEALQRSFSETGATDPPRRTRGRSLRETDPAPPAAPPRTTPKRVRHSSHEEAADSPDRTASLT